MLLVKMIKHCAKCVHEGKKKKKEDLTYIEGEISVVWLETHTHFLFFTLGDWTR